jgi:hypothetical protein
MLFLFLFLFFMFIYFFSRGGLPNNEQSNIKYLSEFIFRLFYFIFSNRSGPALAAENPSIRDAFCTRQAALCAR